jgi:hypothetical protein
MVRPMDKPSEQWTPGEAKEVIENIGKLAGYSSARDAKYNRNYSRFFNVGQALADQRCSIWTAAYQSLGYNPRAMNDDTSLQTKLNVIKSVVDTILSKLSQARVRPFFDSVQGTYATIKATRSAQKFFDAFFDSQKVYERAPEVARSALLFDGGHWWVDEDQLCVEPVPHWELFVDPYEANNGGLRKCTYGMRWRKDYPFTLAKAQFPDSDFNVSTNANPRTLRGEWIIYYDLIAHTKFYIYDKKIIYKKTIDYDRLPFTAMWWTPPITGWSTTCLADDLYTIQVDIDELQLRIDQAVRNSPYNTIFTPAGSDGKATMMTNEAGLIVEYLPGPEGGIPVVSTPAPISDQYLQLREAAVQRAYEFGGVSQLSAQSKKPAGITSGIALQTLEDVESERHNVTVQAYIHGFVELAEIAIDVFPANADIFPPALGRSSVKWSDVKKQKDIFRIQFSAGSSLSKDPATKLDQIQKLQALGINLQPILPQLLEMPDLDTAYSATTASYDYIQTVIERAIERGEIDFAPIADMRMLFNEAIRWFLRLSADDSNKEYIANLKKLIEKVSLEQDKATAPSAGEPGYNAAADLGAGGPLMAGTTAQPNVRMVMGAPGAGP